MFSIHKMQISIKELHIFKEQRLISFNWWLISFSGEDHPAIFAKGCLIRDQSSQMHSVIFTNVFKILDM